MPAVVFRMVAEALPYLKDASIAQYLLAGVVSVTVRGLYKP